MNRPIKFRAWSKENKRMFGNELFEESAGGLLKTAKKFMPNIPHGKEGLYLPLKDEDLTFMQYTGLADRNGKEIYEGDIVHDQDPKYFTDVKGAVERDESGLYVVAPPGLDREPLIDRKQYLAVVGSIYEHPELLEG